MAIMVSGACAGLASAGTVLGYKGYNELGLGAGWMEREHRAFGFPFPETRVRDTPDG
jgi:hypothetical protein